MPRDISDEVVGATIQMRPAQKGAFAATVTVPLEWDVVVVRFDEGDAETANPGTASREIWLTVAQAEDLVRLVHNSIRNIEERALLRLRVPEHLIVR